MNEIDEIDPHGVDILLVEDSPTQLLKLRHVLDRHGYGTLTSARNGEEALAALAMHLPTLVITDINMPGMDGYELCQRIKDDPKLKELPVILLTSLSDPKDILRGLECGADNFIVKPYDEEFLISRIQYVLANLRLRREAGGKATEIYFAGHKYQLTSERIHSIDLLLSTYETAVQKNLELSHAKEQLEQQAEQLREKNAEMQADLEMARELQIAFLPRQYPVFPATASPERSALQFCHRYFTTTDLGGDFYDILALSETQAGVLICDVMGHGVRAALVTAIVRGLVEELKEVALDPGKFVTEINRSLCAILHQTTTPLFATALYAVVDAADGGVRFANAGHPAPFHVRRAAGEIERLQQPGEKPGPALGFVPTATYATFERPLTPGDLLMLFTDGLYEIDGPDETLYEMKQLTEAIARRRTMPTPELFDDLVAELRGFSVTGEFGDDMCLVGLDFARLLRGEPA